MGTFNFWHKERRPWESNPLMSVLQTDAFPVRQVAEADPHTRTRSALHATPGAQ